MGGAAGDEGAPKVVEAWWPLRFGLPGGCRDPMAARHRGVGRASGGPIEEAGCGAAEVSRRGRQPSSGGGCPASGVFGWRREEGGAVRSLLAAGSGGGGRASEVEEKTGTVRF